MAENFILDLIGALQHTKTKKQINSDIKMLEKSINMLRLTATFAKRDTKSELNAYIKSLENQLSQVKLKAKIDSKNLKSEVDKALNGVSFKEIDALAIDESKVKLKARKVIADVKNIVDKSSISIDIGMKKEKLSNNLTTYLNKNTKIKESSVLLEEADKLKDLIDSVDDSKSLKDATTAFQLYKSEVSATGFAAKSTTDRIKGMLSHIAKVGSFFGVASLAVNSFRKSLQTLKDVDTYLTEISKANESLSKLQLAQIGSDSFAVASKYGKTATNYLSAVQEMSRAGYENAAGLSELSVAAQGAGDMTQELANQYIIATDKAYKLGGSVEKLTEVLDGSNYITNHNAVNMTQLAEGMSIVGSQAASLGLAADQTTAVLGTMIATTQQSGSEMARAFRAILLNLQQVTDEEEGIDAEGITKYEAACRDLNVSLKETKNGITSLRDPMEVIKDLAEEYSKLDANDIRRTNLLSSVGGKLRANALNAILENYDMYEKMLKEYAEGTGSMLAEAEKTANSWEGRLNSLQNSWDSFVNTLTNKEAIMGGISFFDRLIQGAEKLTNVLGEAPVLITALNASMSIMNKDYGISQIFNKETGKVDVQGNFMGIDITAIKAQTKHFAEAQGAIETWNKELLKGKIDINDFGEAVVKNNAQLKAYLSTTSKDAPASLSGYKSYLNEAGVSTDALRLKTVLLNTAISFGIGLAVQAAVQGITALIHATEEVRQKAQELGKEFSNTKSEIEDYKEKIEELHKTINDSNSSIEDVTNARKTLMSVQDELIDKFGTEEDTIKNITDAINDQADAFDKLIEKQWQETKNAFNDSGFWNGVSNWFDGYDDNIDRMVNTMENTREILSFSYNDVIGKNGDYSEIKRQIEQLGWVYEYASGGYVKQGNLENIYTDILKIQDLVNDFDAPDMLVNDLTKDANKIKKTIDDYGDMWDQYILQERIFADTTLADSFKEISKAYANYQDSFLSGDKQAIEEALAVYAGAVNTALDNAGTDESVKEYFENMYPALQSAVSEWNFKVAFDANTDDLQDKVQSVLDGLKDESGRQITTEEILGLDKENEQYQELKAIADSYNMTLEEMIALLKERNLVADMDYQGLISLFGQENIDSLIPEDIEIAYQIKNIGNITFNELVEEIQRVKDELNSADSPTFDLTSYEDQIDKIQSSIKTLRDALSSLNTDSLTENTVLDLLQEFPELISYVDMTADGFGNLAAGLNELINAQPTELINSLYELRDVINTEEEREQIDSLINSLQTLATYGDIGIEAYATAIGTTWQNTADVIEGVTTQFENLAKVQEAVSNGLTMSANAAAELAQMYPEILTNAEVTADGQITLNEEVVKSILAGKTATIDAQITQLEADKAVLNAKKEFAEAQLNMLKQVGEGEGQIALETAQYRIEVANDVLKNMIDADEDEAEAYAEAIRVMSMNAEDFDIYVANVATDMATNIDNASVSMANSVAENTTNMQQSFGGLAKKVIEVARAIKAAMNGEEIAVSDEIYGASGGESRNPITTNTTKADQNKYDFTYNSSNLSLDEFTSQLELDIQGYQDAISNIDTQIEILKNLQQTFYDTANSANGGIGGHNYADKIKELEKERDKINNALKDKTSSSSTKDTYDELFDFFERRIDVLNDALNLLSANLDNVVGAFAKNNLLDAQRNLYAEEYRNYSDALAMYQQKASEVLSKLPADIAEKIKNGAVNITEFIGESNKEIVEAIKDYEKWADKIADCSQELAELKTTLRKLELSKFENIISDFTDQFDLRDKSIGLIDKQMALLEEAGELIGESFFTAQKEQAQKQLELLKQEQAQLAGQLSSALASGYVEQGTEEWLSMVSSLSDVESSILDCEKAVEEFDNAILDLNWQVFDRIQKTFSNFSSELSNLAGLLDDIDITDTTGNWTKEAITRLGLYAQQYELARYQVDQYSKAIDDLKKDYLEGKYSATEYADKLAELSNQQWDAVKTTESMKDAIVELNKARVDSIADGIEKEIDSYKALTDEQIKNLKSQKDLFEWQNKLKDLNKSVTDIEKQLAAMEGDNTAATVAKRKKLEQELVNAKADLENEMYQHSVEAQEDALNKQYEDFKSSKEAEIEALQESLNNEEDIISQSFETVKDNASLIADEITSIAQEHGVYVSDALITSWQSGVNAIANYGEVLSSATSSFIANIAQVEQETWNLQKQANATAETLAAVFSTRADNLVDQLTASYYSGANLASMTNYLRDSLVNTLEGNYNVSGITDALNSITNAANAAANAVNGLNSASGSTGSVSAPSNSSSSSFGGNGKPEVGDSVTFTSGKYYNSSDGSGPTGSQMLGQTVYITRVNNASWATKPYHISRDKAGTQPLGWVTLNQLKGYASGVRHLPNDEIAITQEDGTEIILSPVRDGMLLPSEAFLNKKGDPTILKKGDTVLTSEQTDNMFEWSQFNPEEFRKALNIIPQNIMPDIPKVEPRPVNNTIQIDNVLTVQGSIDNGNVRRMEQVAQRAINDAFGRFGNEVNVSR